MHRLSLAAGTLPEFTPGETVAAAAAAGFDAAGIWIDLATWTDATTADVRRRLDDTGLDALDAEVCILLADRGSDEGRRMLDIAAAVGAEHLLVVSRDPDRGRTADHFAELCEHGASVGVRPVIEFMRFMSVRTLAEALAVVDAAGHPLGGVLVDALHLARCGLGPADVAEAAAVHPDRFPYAQLCDAVAETPAEELLVREALDERLLPGEGALPVGELAAVFGADAGFSMELRSAALRRDHPDPVDRASAVLAASAHLRA
ncbi:MAG: sugar phosphate isomerase/epimerase [Ilumatobacteraceae bacterium]|jgi:sugar phosphate isomerase/epimerase|nr:sugar phosphate isomerase/epimerase [Ilumatobacteraceae bacterium]